MWTVSQEKDEVWDAGEGSTDMEGLSTSFQDVASTELCTALGKQWSSKGAMHSTMQNQRVWSPKEFS